MENTYAILCAIIRGAFDSLKGSILIFHLNRQMKEKAALNTPIKDRSKRKSKKEDSSEVTLQNEEPTILKRTVQCCFLNGGLFWFSIFLFDGAVLPLLKYFLYFLFGGSSDTGNIVWKYMQPFLSWTFGAIWVLPIFLLSKFVNSLWFQDIADSAYRHSRGRPQMLSSVSKLIADLLFSILVQALFLVQSMLVSLVPIMILNEILSIVHMCMLYSLYAFEYKWVNMGWELHRRLTFIESNWPYFVGFGLPLAIITALPPSCITSGCLFSMLFPLFIISGNEANPVTGVCDYPLQLFSPVIAISNALFSRTIGPKAVDTSRTQR